MKKLLIGLFVILLLSQESRSIVIPPNNLPHNKMNEVEKIVYTSENRDDKFIFYNNRERLEELKANKKLPSFDVINCYDLEESLNKFMNNKYYNRKLLYLEIIPFYYCAKAFIIYEETKNDTDKENSKKSWWN